MQDLTALARQTAETAEKVAADANAIAQEPGISSEQALAARTLAVASGQLAALAKDIAEWTCRDPAAVSTIPP
jgi:hypothetical protein